jgi:hypothetical protein
VQTAILTDPALNERQKQVLLQIYESFRKENGLGNDGKDTAASGHEDGRGTDSLETEADGGPHAT